MRKVTAVGSIAILLLAVSGCGTSEAVTEDEAKEAFIVGFVSVFSASIGMAFGQPPAGVTLDEATNELTLDGFSIAELIGEDSAIPYTALSGTATTGENEMTASLTLEGGPVESLEFTMSSDQMQSSEGFTIAVTVDGEEMELEITEADMQGE
jgi:hypothetical protein